MAPQPADALARLIGGGVAEARVVAIEAAGLVRLLLNGLPVLVTVPKEFGLIAGDRVALKARPMADGGGRGLDLRRLGVGETAELAGAAGSRSALTVVAAFADGDLAQALMRERGVAAETAVASDVGEPGAAPATGAAQARQAMLPAIRDALTRQTPLPDLLGRVAASLDGPKLYWPPDLRVAMSDFIARALNPQAPTAASDLKHAVQESGVFFESRLAGGDPSVPVRGDLKTSLLSLRALLAALAGRRVTEAPRPDDPAPAAGATARPPLRGEVGPLQLAPADNGFDHRVPAPDQAAILLRETEGALDRVRLLQFASLNDRPGGEAVQPSGVAAQRLWQVEIPMLFAHAPAALPLLIERDGGRGGDAPGPEQAWRMRFSIETPELGHVDVAVGWRGGRIDVRFWADRPETAALIETGEAELSRQLATADLAVDAIRCQAGRRAAPQAPPAPAGQFLDCRS